MHQNWKNKHFFDTSKVRLYKNIESIFQTSRWKLFVGPFLSPKNLNLTLLEFYMQVAVGHCVCCTCECLLLFSWELNCFLKFLSNDQYQNAGSRLNFHISNLIHSSLKWSSSQLFLSRCTTLRSLVWGEKKELQGSFEKRESSFQNTINKVIVVN